MHSSINRVVLVGRLTRDPELRALPSGTTVCSLRLACNGTRKSPDGEYLDKPGYFNVNVFGARGESVQRYMRRGRLLAIDGRLDWREWNTPEGGKRQAVDIVANHVQFLDSPARDDLDGHGDSSVDGPLGGEQPEQVGAGSRMEEDVVF